MWRLISWPLTILKKIILFPFKLFSCLSGFVVVAFVIAVIYVFAADERFQWFDKTVDAQKIVKWNRIESKSNIHIDVISST